MNTQHTPGLLKVGKAFMWHRRECLPIMRASFPHLTVAIVLDNAQDTGLDESHRADASRIAALWSLHDAEPRVLDTGAPRGERNVFYVEWAGVTLLETFKRGDADALVLSLRAAISKATGVAS